MRFLTLMFSTFREAVAKKIFLGFFVIATIIILFFLFLINVDSVEGMVNMMESSGEEGVKQLVTGFEVGMINLSYLLVITFCFIAVSSFIPSMLEKGNIDILLSKPVSRTNIILAKFLGGVLLIFFEPYIYDRRRLDHTFREVGLLEFPFPILDSVAHTFICHYLCFDNSDRSNITKHNTLNYHKYVSCICDLPCIICKRNCDLQPGYKQHDSVYHQLFLLHSSEAR